GMSVEQLPEVRFAQPSVDAFAGLDADDSGDDGRTPEPRGQVRLAEASFTDQPIDPILETCLGTGDGLRGDQQESRLPQESATGYRTGSGGGCVLRRVRPIGVGCKRADRG